MVSKQEVIKRDNLETTVFWFLLIGGFFLTLDFSFILLIFYFHLKESLLFFVCQKYYNLITLF